MLRLNLKVLLLSCLTPLIVLTFSGCSSRLLTSRDYEESLFQHYSGHPQQALSEFPPEEKGGFITTLEKGYLSQLAGKPETKTLQKLAAAIEQRVRYRGSREVKSLFYAETPEGYYASEHEIIWLHLLLSWRYSTKGQYEDGCVEARKASELLTAP